MVIRILLLVLCGMTAHCVRAMFVAHPTDTIIIDGEYITISKKEVPVDVDSLETISNKDLKNRRGSIPLTAHFQLGNSLNRSTFELSSLDLQPLERFMQRNASAQNSLTTQLFLGYSFADISLKGWKINCSANLGIGLGMYKFENLVLNKGDMQQDSLIKLEYEQDALKLIYFDITGIGPDGQIIGELDSINVRTTTNTQRLKTLDVPFKLRFDIGMTEQKPWSFIVDVGFVYRRFTVKNFGPAYLVAESGRYLEFTKNELTVQRSLIRPLLAVGYSQQLSNDFDAGFLSKSRVGFTIQSELSFVTLNQSPSYQIRTDTFSFLLFIGYRF